MDITEATLYLAMLLPVALLSYMTWDVWRCARERDRATHTAGPGCWCRPHLNPLPDGSVLVRHR